MNFKRLSGLALLTSAAGLLLLAQSSCSVIVNDFPVQCESNADCLELAAKQPLGEDGKPIVSAAGFVCNQERKVCEKTGCDTNAACVDSFEGEPAICRKSDRTCQKLILPAEEADADNVCDILADPDDIKNDNTIWIGASVIYAPGSWQGLELVRQDFNGLASGLPPASPTETARRPLAFVYCEADPTLTEGVEHLVNTLELPVVITSIDTTSEIEILENYSKPNEVFQLSTTAGGPQFKSVPNDGLIVDLVLINEHYDIEVAQLVDAYYTPLLRADGGPLLAGEVPRIAVVHSSTPTYENLSRKMEVELEKVAPDNVKLIGYGSADEPSGNPAAYAGVVAEVLEFKPHVIVIMGDDEIGPEIDDAGEVVSEGIDVPIEQGWAEAAPDQPPPQWLGILGTVGQLPKDMGTLEPEARLDWASRTLFIQQHYDFNGELFTSYFSELEQLVQDTDPTDEAGVLGVEQSSPYNEFMREGAYLTAYAIALLGARGDELTGPNVAAAARSFGKKDSNGRPNAGEFTIGEDDIFKAFQAIESTKEPFFLENFQGWVGFDENGFAQYEFADDVACLTPDEEDPTNLGALQPTGGIFDIEGALTGTVSLTGCAAP
jgi:hypothetical protein